MKLHNIMTIKDTRKFKQKPSSRILIVKRISLSSEVMGGCILTQIGDLARQHDGVAQLGGDLLPLDEELRLQLIPLQPQLSHRLGRGGLVLLMVLLVRVLVVRVGRVEAATSASSIVSRVDFSIRFDFSTG